MDNMSRRHSDEDTTSSMYLSFDAESTMSTACYKTMEAMSDISVLSSIDINESVNLKKTADNEMNNTLELEENSLNLSFLKTVKKIAISDVKVNTPLKVFQKNILKEYKALCSTPSREMLLKTVDVTRGSDALRCVDLGLAFLGVDDEKPAYFPPIGCGIHDENKENILPDAEETSTLSTCSSVENATTVIEKKMISSISTVGSIAEEESVEDKNSIEIPMIIVDDCSTTHAALDDATKAMEPENEIFNTMNLNEKNSESTPKAKTVDIIYMEPLRTNAERMPLMKELKIESKNTKEKSTKQKISVLTANESRSVCEPNLKANKPSNTFDSGKKRRSFLPTSKKPIANVDAENEIPSLMSKMLKITNTALKTEQNNIQKADNAMKNFGNPTSAEKRTSAMSSVKKRTSLIPSAPGYKRPFNFNQRMSVVVKTTLNSPARKIVRKSSINAVASSSKRRSIIPQKITASDKSQVKKTEASSSKGMLPKPSGVSMNTNTSNSLPGTFNKPSSTNAQRKSIYFPGNVSEKCMFSTNENLSKNKLNISYTCNVCKEKFRIKSLLDAHKRSHETDNKPPAFVKKPLNKAQSMSGSVFGNSNQCKYCDKKFALLKALHIHLLQNCLKIPPSEKRKLEFTELNHVEKAQLPVFTHQSMQNNALNWGSSTNIAPRYTLKPNIAISSSESLNENKDTQKITSNLTTVNGNNGTASQGTNQKPKKITAHTGVYRTPSKSVPCHLCKVTFKSILEYTNHNLTTHGSYKAIAADNTEKV